MGLWVFRWEPGFQRSTLKSLTCDVTYRGWQRLPTKTDSIIRAGTTAIELTGVPSQKVVFRISDWEVHEPSTAARHSDPLQDNYCQIALLHYNTIMYSVSYIFSLDQHHMSRDP